MREQVLSGQEARKEEQTFTLFPPSLTPPPSDLHPAGSAQLHQSAVGDSGLQRPAGTRPPTGLHVCQ